MLSDENNSVALALLVFFQNFGGAILLAIAETVFSYKLVSEIPKYAPDVNSTVVKAAGASGFREVIQPAQLDGVLKAYNSALTTEFYLAIACTAAMLVICWAMGWAKAVNEDKEREPLETRNNNEHQLADWENGQKQS